MGYITSFIIEFRRSRKLRKLSRILGSTRLLHLGFFSDEAEKEMEARDQALEELLDLCENDPLSRLAMEDVGANREALRETYSDLVRAGAGQWIKRHYVAASAIAYPWTLDYCLRARRDSSLSKERIAYDMIRFFQGYPIDTDDS